MTGAACSLGTAAINLSFLLAYLSLPSAAMNIAANTSLFTRAPNILTPDRIIPAFLNELVVSNLLSQFITEVVVVDQQKPFEPY